jgi:hypothetical protein
MLTLLPVGNSQPQPTADSRLQLTHIQKSKLYYDRRSVGQSLLVWSPIWDPRPDFCCCQTVAGLMIWGPSLTRGRTCHVQLVLVRADSRLPQPGWPDPRICILQGQGGPVIPLGTGCLFVASYDSQGCGGGLRIRLQTCCCDHWLDWLITEL